MDHPDHLQPRHPSQTVVLLTEDEVQIQDMVRVALEEEGYFVLTAHDGQEAVQIARGFKGPIHLLLTDVMMPHMNGLELRCWMQRERPETEVLLMSATPPAGLDVPLLTKPFTMKRLIELMHNIVPRPVCYSGHPESRSAEEDSSTEKAHGG